MKLTFTDDNVVINSVNYSHYSRRENLNLHDNHCFCDVQLYIQDNQQSIVSDIEKWHTDLYNFFNPRLKYWFLTLSSRLEILHPIFEPLIFSIGLIEYCKKNCIDELQVINCPNEVLQYIKELSPSSEILDERSQAKNKKKSHIFNSLIKASKFSGKFILNSLFFSRKKIKIDEIKNIVFTSASSKESLQKFDDRYYGKMLENAYSLKYVNTLWLFIRDVKASHNKNIMNSDWKYENVLHFLTLGDVFRTLKVSVCEYILVFYYSRKNQSIVISDYKSHVFYRYYVQQVLLSHLIVNEFAIYTVIKKILLRHDVGNIIYPMEGKTMENAILFATKEDNSVKTIGYVHAFSHNLDSCLKSLYSRGINLELESDIIATTGETISIWMKEWGGYPKHKIVNFGSHKYKDLIPRKTNKVKPCLLIALSLNSELIQLANFIESDNTIFEAYDVVLRPGPTVTGIEQDKHISKILSMTDNFQLNNDTMINQIQWSDIVIFNVTSVGIESVLMGRIAIYVSLSNIFEIDTLEGRADKKTFLYSSNLIQLKSNMSKIFNLSNDEYNFYLSKQYDYAKNIYAKEDLDNINKVIV